MYRSCFHHLCILAIWVFGNLCKNYKYIIFANQKEECADIIGAARGENMELPPPEIEKMLLKNNVISESSIFSNNLARNR